MIILFLIARKHGVEKQFVILGFVALLAILSWLFLVAPPRENSSTESSTLLGPDPLPVGESLRVSGQGTGSDATAQYLQGSTKTEQQAGTDDQSVFQPNEGGVDINGGTGLPGINY